MNYKQHLVPCHECGGGCGTRPIKGKRGHERLWVVECHKCTYVSEECRTATEAAAKHNMEDIDDL